MPAGNSRMLWEYGTSSHGAICPEQNGHAESFHKTLKKEYIEPHEFERYKHARDVLKDAYTDYNNVRIHYTMGYVTPQEFLKEQEMTNK